MKNSILSIISNRDWGMISQNGAYIRFSSVEEARTIAGQYFQDLVATAKKLGGVLIIFGGDRKVYQIDKSIYQNYDASQHASLNKVLEMAELIYYSGTEGIPPQLYELSRRLFDIDGNAGIVRMRDGKQIIINDAAGEVLKVKSFADATNRTREQYFHPGDLPTFLQRCRQELEPNNPQSLLEHTYRAFDVDLGINSNDGWRQFTTQYTLHEVAGNFYQICQAVAVTDISRPTDLIV